MNHRVYCLALVLGLLGFGCSPATNTTAPEPQRSSTPSGQKVVIALKPDKNPDKMLEEKKALEAFLSQNLNRPVEVIVPLASSVILEGFANGTVDVGYLSSTEMVTAKDQGSASILLAGEINGKPGYQSYWVALKEKPYASIADLKGKPVAFASRTSTSGYLIPHWDLIKKGLLPPKTDPDEFFGKGNVQYGSGYVSAIERVLNGEAEAAAVSYYVLDQDKHLTQEQRDKLRKIAEQGPVPSHVFAVRSALSDQDRQLLKNALLSMNNPGNQELRDKLFTSKLIEVEEQTHLAPVREALVLTGKLAQ